MATTLLTLKSYYSNLMRTDFAHIPTTDQTLLTSLSSQVDAGTLTTSAAQQQILKLALGTTSVASVAYSFFAGGTPNAGGLNYLVSPNWDNPNNLNSAYYQSYSTENRYIAFAMNLGKYGEGQAWFTTNYGSLSLSDALVKAYTTIFGFAPDAAKVDALLNGQVPDGQGGTYTRAQYFASYGGDGLTGQGTKAAMIGWLMSEAMKADTGVYAQANDAFLADLAQDGIAAFRSDLVTAYGSHPAGSAGVTLTATADHSISPTATDATLKSTAGDDTITGTAGLGAAYSVDAGAGHDTISLTGTIYGQVLTSDGYDTITLGALGVSTPTLGVPAVAGSVMLTGGNDVVTLKGDLAAGTSLTATGTNNVLHVDAGTTPTFQGTVSGFQTVYYHSSRGPAVSGASVIYDVISDPTDTGQFYYRATNHEVIILKDTSNGAVLSTPAVPTLGAKLEVHLQNYHGAPTTTVNASYNYYYADGGSIGFYVNADGPLDEHGTLLLHVDSDSTAGLIYGWTTNVALGPGYRGSVPNLTISGPGALTAQIANTFTNVDASQAGDLNISYALNNSTTGQTLRLGDGTNTLHIYFAGTDGGVSTDLATAKIYLGAGADTVIAGTDIYSGGAIQGFLDNLVIKNGTTLGPAPEFIGFQKGVDHLVMDTMIHTLTTGVQTYADGKASLQDALIAVSAHVAVNTAAVFTWNGDTYIYAQDGVVGVNTAGSNAGMIGDGLIKLTGVTGLTVGTGAGSYDIHYG